MSNLRFVALGGAVVLALGLALGLAGCGGDSVRLTGAIHIDGSATLAPLTKAMARRFVAEHPDVRITVDTSGTRRDFTALCRGRADVSDAVRPIDAAATAACARAGVTWREVPVVNDAVILMVNRAVPVRCLTTAQLAQIWHGNSEVTLNWGQVDDLDPPYDGELTAWGPGTDTETYAFFTKAVNHNEGETRDYNNGYHKEARPVEAIAETVGDFGYARYRFYAARRRAVRAIAVDSGSGCVAPTPATIADGSFRPFSRRLYLYPSAKAAARPTVRAFLDYYLDNAADVAPQAGFVPLTDDQLAASKARLKAGGSS